jgi:predicted Zn-dependent protease
MDPNPASKALFHYASLRESLIATAFAVLLLVAGCASTGSQRTWDANAIPASGSDQIRLQAKNADGSTATVDYVRRDQVVQYREMVKKIGGTANQYVSKVVISDADQINAFAGFDKSGSPTIGITLKMLRLISDDPDALAALVGHEISHLKIGHSKDKAEFNAGAEAIATVAGIVLQAFGIPMARTISGVGKGVVVAAYSRDKETEADEMGIRLAFEAGYDPQGAVRLYQKLEQASNTFQIPFLTTHPFSSERIENMSALAAQLKSDGSSQPAQPARR